MLQSSSLYILLLLLITRLWSCYLLISTLSLIVPADSVMQFWPVPKVLLMKRIVSLILVRPLEALRCFYLYPHSSDVSWKG